MKKYDLDTLYQKLQLYLKRYNSDFYNLILKFPEEYNKKILKELQTRIKKFDELENFTTFFYHDAKIPSLEDMINEKMKITETRIIEMALKLTISILQEKNTDFESVDEVKELFIEKIQQADMKNGQVLWPTRYALS